MPKTIAEIGEFSLIDLLDDLLEHSAGRVILGIGDDAAGIEDTLKFLS